MYYVNLFRLKINPLKLVDKLQTFRENGICYKNNYFIKNLSCRFLEAFNDIRFIKL